MVRVKVCGLMNERDVISCAEAGIHTLGFVADYPEPVPWNLTRDEARRLIARVPPYMHMCGNRRHAGRCHQNSPQCQAICGPTALQGDPR